METQETNMDPTLRMQTDQIETTIAGVMALGMILEPFQLANLITVKQFIRAHEGNGDSFILVMESLNKPLNGQPTIHFGLLVDSVLKFCQLDHLGVRLFTAQRIYKPKQIN